MIKEYIREVEKILADSGKKLEDFPNTDWEYYACMCWNPNEVVSHIMSYEADTTLKTIETGPDYDNELSHLREHFDRMNKDYKEKKRYIDHKDVLWKNADGLISLWEEIRSLSQKAL